MRSPFSAVDRIGLPITPDGVNSWWSVAKRKNSWPWNATSGAPSFLTNASGIELGRSGTCATARSMRTSDSSCAITCEVSSSLECQPGVSSGGFSMMSSISAR